MRVAFWWIPLYTLRVAVGALAGALWLWRQAPRAEFDRRAMLPWLWGATLAALLGGRVGYVIGNTAYFTQNPALLLRLDRVGGLYGGSALLAVLFVTVVWARTAHRPLSAIVSFLSPAALLIAAGAWWGCADAGCAWGRELAAPDGARWLTALLPDIYQTVTLRYAVQPIGAAWALLLAMLAALLRKRQGVALALYWLGAAGLTLLRADPMPTLGGARADTALDLALATGMMTLMLYNAKGTHHG